MRFLKRRKAFTFIEILIVVLLVTTLSTMGVGVFSGVLEYFRCRRSMESLMWDLRKAQQRARSRGHSRGFDTVGGSPANFGVAFYAGRVTSAGIDPAGYSYYVYGPSFIVPPSNLAALTALGPNFFRENLHEFDPALVPVANGAVGGAAVTPPANSPPGVKRIQFTDDVNSENGDMIPDATSGVAAPNNFMDFRLQSGEGYFRISFDNDRYIGLRYVAL